MIVAPDKIMPLLMLQKERPLSFITAGTIVTSVLLLSGVSSSLSKSNRSSYTLSNVIPASDLFTSPSFNVVRLRCLLIIRRQPVTSPAITTINDIIPNIVRLLLQLINLPSILYPHLPIYRLKCHSPFLVSFWQYNIHVTFRSDVPYVLGIYLLNEFTIIPYLHPVNSYIILRLFTLEPIVCKIFILLYSFYVRSIISSTFCNVP